MNITKKNTTMIDELVKRLCDENRLIDKEQEENESLKLLKEDPYRYGRELGKKRKLYYNRTSAGDDRK
jgi:hypothetical protein